MVLLLSCSSEDRLLIVPPPPVDGVKTQVVSVQTEIDQKVLAISSDEARRLVMNIPIGQNTRVETFAYTRDPVSYTHLRAHET